MKPAVVLFLAALALAGAARAQAPPRDAAGHPDLTGVWSNASLTQLERPARFAGPTLTESQARTLAANDPSVRRGEADAAPTAADAPVPAGSGIGFNAFWLDSGTAYAKVKGERRTSWIVEPADGRMPLTALGERRNRESAVTRAIDHPAGPEAMSPNDRCLIGSRGSGGPGMLNNVYNSNYQIVLTPASIAIVSEMIHEARTIAIYPDRASAQAAHGPAVMARWLGDSVAWWEGPELVIETINVNPQQGVFGPIFLSAQAKVTERLSRVSPTDILYAFAVSDPVHYTKVWRAEMTLSAIKGPIYEYACHEGNYAIAGILAGARKEEAGR